jgi:hypothetical protein
VKHRRLLVGSIIGIPSGFVLMLIGAFVARTGIYSYQTGWWIFSQYHTGTTTAYWVGLVLMLLGLIVIIGGITGIIIAVVLEFLDRGKAETAQEIPATPPKPP